jgi:hypothetical protein
MLVAKQSPKGLIRGGGGMPGIPTGVLLWQKSIGRLNLNGGNGREKR